MFVPRAIRRQYGDIPMMLLKRVSEGAPLRLDATALSRVLQSLLRGDIKATLEDLERETRDADYPPYEDDDEA